MPVHRGGKLGNNSPELVDFITRQIQKHAPCLWEHCTMCSWKKLRLFHREQSSSSSQACLCTWCQFLCVPRHHTHADSVKWIGSQPSNCCDGLCNHPTDEGVSVLGIWKHSLCSVIDTKVGSAVGDNTLHRHTKAGYRPFILSDLYILARQSPRPLTFLSAADLSTSASRWVWAEPRGYTKHKDAAPVAPPNARCL